MTTTPSSVAQLGTGRLSPTTYVALRTTGLMLPAVDDIREMPLGVADLLVLQALAAPDASINDIVAGVSNASQAPQDEVRTFVEHLRDRGLILSSDTPVHQLTRDPFDETDVSATDEVEGTTHLLAVTPLVFSVGPRGFTATNHHGDLLVQLDAVELIAAAEFVKASSLDDAAARHRESHGPIALTDQAFRSLATRLLGHRLLNEIPPDAAEGGIGGRDRAGNLLRKSARTQMLIKGAVAARIDALDEAELEREATTGVKRIHVYPMHMQRGEPPLALGMIMAYAMAYDGGRLQEQYRFVPDWALRRRSLRELPGGAAVYLFSNYLWSHAECLYVSGRVKKINPACLTIHGGPDTPGYDEDVRAYFEANPHVDVAVHGEGEVTVAEILSALAGSIGNRPLDLSPLRDVPGLSFRDGDDVVHTGKRERLADLDVIPSPFLTGLFDAYGEVPNLSVTLETNRGCPYGCTFCDWGSNTLARIRKFDLERVFAELEWCAQHQVIGIGLADANFGIFERDVEIAEKVVELNARYGYPIACSGSYAKNTVKHLTKIISTWIDAGLLTLGVLSLQTLDDDTLEVVRRSNIKTEKYDALAREFRKANLPLYVDIMMGLPGSTYASFVSDLQSCIEREVQAKIHQTALLINSPMNDPAYREEHRIEVQKPGSPGNVGPADLWVVSTKTLSRDDFAQLRELRRMYLLCENFGVLRHVARYVRHETGGREIDFYEGLRRKADAEPWRWPAVYFVVHNLHEVMCAPGSWRSLIDEVHDFLVNDVGIADDSALRAVLDVQHALLPSIDRTFPCTIELPHDYVAWHEAMIDAKQTSEASDDWTRHVPSLRDLPPGRLTVDDPQGVCQKMLGSSLESAWFDCWELESPLARPNMFSTAQGPPVGANA